MFGKISTIILKTILVITWAAIYWYLQDLSKGLVSFISLAIPSLQSNPHLYEALAFFLYDTPKVFMLLITVVFSVGIIRTYFSPERTRRILAGKNAFIGNILAALLGIVTPFCSCSAVPLFIGFLSAGVPLGATFSFLVSAPMVNEVALVLLFGLFGWKVAALYLSTGLFVAMIAGFVLGRIRLDHWVEDWVWKVRANAQNEEDILTWTQRLDAAKEAVREVIGKVWKWVILGIALGAVIHGYVPQDFFLKILGADSWWSVPLAVVLGVPMYSNAAGIVPIISALLEKGAALGTSLAFMMAVIALSLPEAILLRKVLKPQLLGIFFGTVALGIMLVGYLFNIILH